MLLKIIVSHSVRDDFSSDYLFDEGPVTIGRLPENKVVLPDRELIVGRHHAVIYLEEAFAWIVDESSKNFTFLNGEKLEHGKKYQLRDQDHLEIGKYQLRLLDLTPKDEPDRTPEAEGQTAVQPAYNPFTDLVRGLTDVLQQIKASYVQADPGTRLIDLENAFHRGLGALATDEIALKMVDAIRPKAESSPVQVSALSAEPEKLQGVAPLEVPGFVPYAGIDVQNKTEWERAIGGIYSTGQDGLILKRMAVVDDVMLRIVEKLIKIPAHFRLEFLGHSFIPHASGFPFHTATVEQYKAFLYDIHVPYEVLRARLSALEQIADAVLYHEIALLEGYKQAVQSGVLRILDQLNPEYIKNVAEKEGQDLYTVGMLSHAKWLKLVQQAHYELVREDKGVVEKTIFRPGFVKAYLAKIESVK
ncbi:MAG: FHA domain-containing protein [Bacteroidetes Order II. Incertae sedis bacterium]|nr:FHA domain-containing protein [Bacteroidetes Order II. bacterium]